MCSTPRVRKYRNKLRRRAYAQYGYVCCVCGSKENREFAHREKSNLGMGRGFHNRINTAITNMNMFILLCHDCHTNYDNKETD